MIIKNEVKKNMKNGAKIALVIIIVAITVFAVGAMTSNNNHANVKNVTTPYNTTCKLNIGEGIISEETTVNEDGQKLTFSDGTRKGVFISTTKDVSDLLNSIKTHGTLCKDDNVTWYHMKDQQLVNTYSPFGGTHLKLADTNEYDVGFMENPNNDEVIILVASPNTIVDCFKTIEWGK